MRSRIVGIAMLCVFSLAGMRSGEAAPRSGSFMVPPDTPETFVERYRYLLRKDERKAFERVQKELKNIDKKLRKIDEQVERGKISSENVVAERQELVSQRKTVVAQLPPMIEAFWKPRDPLPATPENEYKTAIDQRIEDMAQERFFTTPEAPGLTFRNNGGYYGDLARVFLLHGPPAAMSTVEGSHFVPLMLWLYADPSDGGILYAFMFYQSISGPPYRLFEQDTYAMNPCAAINEISSRRMMVGMQSYACTTETTIVYRDLVQSIPTGNLNGYLFAWALVNFSRDPSIRLGEALSAPEPVAHIARRSTSRVIGGSANPVVESGVEVLRAQCAPCKSMIPAELVFTDAKRHLAVKRSSFDWFAKKEELSSEMFFVIILESLSERVPIVHRQTVWVRSSRTRLAEDADATLTIPLFKPDEFAAVPAGPYLVSVYLRSTLTNRYNAWQLHFVKQ